MVKSGLKLPESPNTALLSNGIVGGQHIVKNDSEKVKRGVMLLTDKLVRAGLHVRDLDLNPSEQDVETGSKSV